MTAQHLDNLPSQRGDGPLTLAMAAALIGDPVRAAILNHLADGSRRPAGELAVHVGDQFAPDHGWAAGQRLVVTRIVRFVSTDEEEIVDDMRIYLETAGARLRSV